MYIANNDFCCGFKELVDLDVSDKQLDDWLTERFPIEVSRRFVEHNKSGKLFQCIFAEYQWNMKKHRIMLKHGWKRVAKWHNSSGTVCRAYQYVHPEAKRMGC